MIDVGLSKQRNIRLTVVGQQTQVENNDFGLLQETNYTGQVENSNPQPSVYYSNTVPTELLYRSSWEQVVEWLHIFTLIKRKPICKQSVYFLQCIMLSVSLLWVIPVTTNILFHCHVLDQYTTYSTLNYGLVIWWNENLHQNLIII